MRHVPHPHPLRGSVAVLSTAAILVFCMPDGALRYALGVACVVSCWRLFAQLGIVRWPYKKPPLTQRERWDLMIWHIDRGLDLAEGANERSTLRRFIDHVINQRASSSRD